MVAVQYDKAKNTVQLWVAQRTSVQLLWQSELAWHSHCRKLVSNVRCSISDTESDRLFEGESSHGRHSIDSLHHRGHAQSKQSVPGIELINAHFQTALKYNRNRLSDSSQLYDVDNAGGVVIMVKRVRIQLNLQISFRSGRSSILSLLLVFQIVCKSSGIHKRAPMVLFHSFMKKHARAALYASICRPIWSLSRHEFRLESYYQVINYFSETCSVYNIIFKSDMDIMNFKKTTDQSPVNYCTAFWAEALRCRPLYHQFRLMETFSRRLKKSIPQRIWRNRSETSQYHYMNTRNMHCPSPT